MKLIPILMTAFLGYSCAAKKMTAQNADLLIEYQMQKRLQLYSKQKDELSKDIDKFLTDQKPFIHEIVPVVSSVELKSDKVDEQYDKLNGYYKKLALNFSALMSKYMAILDEKQQKEFQKNLKEENQKLAREDQKKRMEKVEDRFKTLFGSITSSQKKLLESHKSYFNERHALRLKRREELNAKFMDIYKTNLSKEERAKSFQTAFSDFQNGYPEDPKNKQIIKNLIPTLSDHQKKEFKENIQDLKEMVGYYIESTY